MDQANLNINVNGLFSILLSIVFITLKLTKTINWAWWLVLLPLYWWIPVLLIILIILSLCHILKI